jgi:hypothetical protein
MIYVVTMMMLSKIFRSTGPIALFALIACTQASLAEEAYLRDETADPGGASWADDIVLAPLFLVDTFGMPADHIGLRVTGSYTFVSPEGLVFFIHDFKQTSLWDETFQTPEEFWASDGLHELTIGSSLGPGDADVAKFKRWLSSEFQIWQSQR